jgi:biotin carboxyl carrier protein
MKKFDTNTADELVTRLREKPARQTLTPFELIKRIHEQLSSAQGRAIDLDELMGELRDAGLTLKRNTVRNYLSRARAAQRNRTQHAQMASAPLTASNQAASPKPIGSAPFAPSPPPAAATTTRAATTTNVPAPSPGQWVMTPDREVL